MIQYIDITFKGDWATLDASIANYWCCHIRRKVYDFCTVCVGKDNKRLPALEDLKDAYDIVNAFNQTFNNPFTIKSHYQNY